MGRIKAREIILTLGWQPSPQQRRPERDGCRTSPNGQHLGKGADPGDRPNPRTQERSASDQEVSGI